MFNYLTIKDIFYLKSFHARFQNKRNQKNIVITKTNKKNQKDTTLNTLAELHARIRDNLLITCYKFYITP